MKTTILLTLCILLSSTDLRADQTETATFAAGCFWGTEEMFRTLDGVIETKVGYIGGDKKATYEQVSAGNTGHAESVEIKFDPKKISYQDLLDRFFKMHDPTTLNRQGNDEGTHYRSAIFTHNPAQMKIATEFKMKVEKSGAWKKPITTEIKNASTFYDAEEYHQKYLVKVPGGYDNHYLRNINFNPSTEQEKESCPFWKKVFNKC